MFHEMNCHFSNLINNNECLFVRSYFYGAVHCIFKNVYVHIAVYTLTYNPGVIDRAAMNTNILAKKPACEKEAYFYILQVYCQ